jgi:hypothetical protein
MTGVRRWTAGAALVFGPTSTVLARPTILVQSHTGRKIKNEINALMECARGKAKTGKTKAYPQRKVNEIFRSILEFVEKAPSGPGEAMHPEAATKGD